MGFERVIAVIGNCMLLYKDRKYGGEEGVTVKALESLSTESRKLGKELHTQLLILWSFGLLTGREGEAETRLLSAKYCKWKCNAVDEEHILIVGSFCLQLKNRRK